MAQRISGRTRFGGLLGRDISYSLSPLIHNFAAEQLGLDCVYLNFDVPAAPSAGFFEALRGSNCFGFNVTVPYKEEVAQLLGGGSVSSCNTLIPAPQGWTVASTDAEGYLRGLLQHALDIESMQAVICLGHGGAAKAILETLAARFPSLPRFVLRRRAAHTGETEQLRAFSPSALDEILQQYPRSLVIQASSAPDTELSGFLPVLTQLQGGFSELAYGRPSSLLTSLRERGVRAQDGLPMLVHQALLSEELWWGQSADPASVFTLLREQGYQV